MLLLTGANGFLGNSLSTFLRQTNIEYRAITRNKTSNSIGVGAIDGSTQWSTPRNDVGVIVHSAARVHVIYDLSADPLSELEK
jgi:UDP-glucose 4-epimerase